MKKTLIITGASKGIGYATLSLFQTNDWNVVNISRSPCPLENSINLGIDLSNPNATKKLKESLEFIVNKSSQICLVHNAACHINDTINNQNPDDLIHSLNVAIVSPSIINKIVIPLMTKGSSIIYVGSTLSEKAVPGAASYVISKHAIVGMMRSTCQDLAGKDIHTACICPGFTNTEMLQHHLNNDPAMYEFAVKKVGAERLIEPKEIADLIYFSALNPVINGSVIHANLGQVEN